MDTSSTDPLLDESDRIGVIGSNSTTGSLVVDLVGDSRSRALSGKMVVAAPTEYDGSREYAMGVVTDITTTNQYHENPSLRGVVSINGSIGNLTGKADIKTAKVEVQSAFRRTETDTIRPVGGSLSFAPSTGEGVYIANNDLVQHLARQATDDLFYLGTIYRQKDILLPLSFHDFGGPRGSSMAAFFGPSGSGKALDVDTPIPTPHGFVRMGDLVVGDHVLGRDGTPTRVEGVFDQPPNRPCFEVTFSDGTTLIADAEHQWTVTLTGSSAEPQTVTMTTAEVADALTRHEVSIPGIGTAQHAERDLPADPYEVGVRAGQAGLGHLLDDEYLTAGTDQRRRLLAGVIDGAGVTHKAGMVRLGTADASLAERIHGLVCSLGRLSVLAGHSVTFIPGHEVLASTHHPQPVQNTSITQQVALTARCITAVTPVASRPVRCITVAADDSLYLAGRAYVPTHNTHLATSFVASQTRHRNMSFLLIDPQGQFTTSSKVGSELPVDLRALAEAQGREVQQLSVSHEVRLPPDASLFTDLLDGASFFGAARMIGARTNAKEAKEVVLAWLEDVADDWADRDAEDLLDDMLDYLYRQVLDGAVAASEKVRERISDQLRAATENFDEAGQARRAALLRVWRPFHSLFAPNSLDGTPRKPMQEIVKGLCDPDTGWAGNRKGRPFYVLTLADPRLTTGEESEVTRAMKRTANQMIVLQTLFDALEEEGRRIYQDDAKDPANVMVILDEAARFTSDSSRDPQQRSMALKIARYFRELRKYAIGFTLILQEPSALEASIWKQLQNGFRAFAGGLVGNDLDKVREQISSPGSLRLYQQLAQPTADNAVYPWVFCGSISPLSVTSEPSFMEAFTSPQQWAQANKDWLPGTFDVTDVWVG